MSSPHPTALCLVLTEVFPDALRGMVTAMCSMVAKLASAPFGPDTALVVVEEHVHHPMQAVLNGPVAADGRSDEMRQHNQRCSIKSRLMLDFPLVSRLLSTITMAFGAG